MTSPARARPRPPAPAPLKPAVPLTDPRAVRVGVAPTSRAEGDPTLTISPAPAPVLRPIERLADLAVMAGAPAGDAGLLLDGQPLDARLVSLDLEHLLLIEGAAAGGSREPLRTRLILGPERRRDGDGATLREVVVEGWRIEVEVEGERRAALRERARRGHDVAAKSGPIEVRAIIPGRIVALSVGPGDEVAAGQQLLVLEAMKMQNELRAPREGAIERVPVAVGENVEVGDLLMVIT